MIEQNTTNVESEVSQLYNDMHTQSLTPLWKIEESLMAAQPQPKTIPWLWKWDTFGKPNHNFYRNFTVVRAEHCQPQVDNVQLSPQ